MARIFYGVMGDARGHLSRSLSVAQHMPGHEFLFAGGGTVADLRLEGYNVVDLEMLATKYKKSRVDFLATVGNALSLLLTQKNSIVRRLARVIEEFNPDLILSDYEFFTPLAARYLGRPCVSLDHQHVLTHTHYDQPPGQFVNRRITFFPIMHLYSNATCYMVSSFFQPPAKDPNLTEIFPPILRTVVKEHTPREEEHALVYSSGGAYKDLLPFLKGRNRKFIIYGFGEQPSSKNLVFKKNSVHGFLEDLVGAQYVISNGGHSLISEALYYGKPVLCFPIHFLYEQFLNGYFLQKYCYGRFSMNPVIDKNIIDEFEDSLLFYKKHIHERYFWGNDKVVQRLESLFRCE